MEQKDINVGIIGSGHLTGKIAADAIAIEPKGIMSLIDVKAFSESPSYKDATTSDVKDFFSPIRLSAGEYEKNKTQGAIVVSSYCSRKDSTAKQKSKRKKRNAQAKKSRKQNRR